MNHKTPKRQSGIEEAFDGLLRRQKTLRMLVIDFVSVRTSKGDHQGAVDLSTGVLEGRGSENENVPACAVDSTAGYKMKENAYISRVLCASDCLGCRGLPGGACRWSFCL